MASTRLFYIDRFPGDQTPGQRLGCPAGGRPGTQFVQGVSLSRVRCPEVSAKFPASGNAPERMAGDPCWAPGEPWRWQPETERAAPSAGEGEQGTCLSLAVSLFSAVLQADPSAGDRPRDDTLGSGLGMTHSPGLSSRAPPQASARGKRGICFALCHPRCRHGPQADPSAGDRPRDDTLGSGLGMTHSPGLSSRAAAPSVSEGQARDLLCSLPSSLSPQPTSRSLGRRPD